MRIRAETIEARAELAAPASEQEAADSAGALGHSRGLSVWAIDEAKALAISRPDADAEMRMFGEDLDQQHGRAGSSNEELRDAPADGAMPMSMTTSMRRCAFTDIQACFLLARKRTVAS
jgi:hypothetical protein